jgi:8-oxo-dGTP diphosphatase
MDQHPRHIVAVMGMVTDKRDRILLVRSDRRGWEPPGGQVERGEDLIVALKREIAEESCCDVEVGRLVGVYSNVGTLGIVMFTFLCTHIGGEPQGGEECDEAGWFTRDEALRLVTHPAQATKLRDALDADSLPGIAYGIYRTALEQDALGNVRYTHYEPHGTQRC